jgi:hypothetical protein
VNVNPRNFCSRWGRVHYDAGAMCSHCEAADRRNATMAAERLARREGAAQANLEGARPYRHQRGRR